MTRLLCTAALLMLVAGCDNPSNSNNNAANPATQPSQAAPETQPSGSGALENAIPATQPAAPATQPSAAADAKPVNKFCAVDTDNPIDPTVATVTYKGKVIGFCCEDCIPKFKKDPEKYMASLK